MLPFSEWLSDYNVSTFRLLVHLHDLHQALNAGLKLGLAVVAVVGLIAVERGEGKLQPGTPTAAGPPSSGSPSPCSCG